MIALISDIHANLEALRAVLDDIDAQGTGSMIYCLGDLVGYGPDAVACVDLVQERGNIHLMGNHDNALFHGPIGFNALASTAIELHRRQLEPQGDNPVAVKRWHYLRDLRISHEEGEFLFVHASPRDALTEYLLPGDVIYDVLKVADVFAHVRAVCFVGHTHVPGVMTPEPAFQTPEEVGGEYAFGDGKAVINIGSVGQPRDGDPRACYVELHEDGVRWRRVEYDFEETYRKIRAIPELDDRLGERLTVGC